MNLTTFRMIVAYISMTIFFGIPVVRTLMGSPLSITELSITLAIAIGFGIYATTQLQKYDREKLQNNSQTGFEEYKDTILKEKCPKCNSKLMEIKNLTKDNTPNSFYKGLVHCTACDYEVSSDQFDKERSND